ncbi:hypothetical protein AK830_g8910 [Neonectria ditissima]|uniref:Uncharacterized protein n=1 Tax=Neonectria ditissima TaxID=78410 RepID=A0A0P7ASV9_9HYPO|nr:hypothetical protein AK830_g8910 [Neonectria ditissima]
MRQFTATLALVALAACPLIEAASTTRTSTETIFLPSQSTGSASRIYASIITQVSSRTEYLLACQTAFSSPYSCDGPFNGVTVTYGASEMDVKIGAATYDCELGSSAVCATKTASSDDESTTTLNSRESASWMTAITVLRVEKKTSKTASSKSTTAKAAETDSDSKLCKRRTTGHSSGHSGSDSDSDSGSKSGSGSDSSSDSSSDSTSDESSSGSGSSKSSKSNGDSNASCSAGSRVTRDLGVSSLLLGASLVFVFAL